MAGIVVGTDGSRNASRALEWAMAEAATRKAHLTVVTVLPVAASYWTGRPAPFPGDHERVAEIRKSAEEAVAATAAMLGSSQPESVTVTAASGFPAETLIQAAKDSDMLVVGTRGGGVVSRPAVTGTRPCVLMLACRPRRSAAASPPDRY
jgi:nucleotide-binding universal stress UspA family protein